jgi:hypothetical protein
MAESAHLRLFDFTGRLVGKALYEGIVLDAALADFFAARLLGKHASIDELPSLDQELHASLQARGRGEGRGARAAKDRTIVGMGERWEALSWT